MLASVPRADGMLNIISAIEKRLYQEKHLLRLLNVETVVHGVALLTLSLLQDVVAFPHTNRGDLHRTTGRTADSPGVSPLST